MLITKKYVSELTPESIAKLSLATRCKIATKITIRGFQSRMTDFLMISQSVYSRIINGKSRDAAIESFLNTVTEKMLQTYIKNINISKEEMLKIEESIKESAAVTVADAVK